MNVPALMRTLLSWLLVFMAMAGLNARVLANPAYEGACSHVHETCCSDHHDSTESDGHDHDGQKCPPEHHHHHGGCCSHLPAIDLESHVSCRLGVPGESLMSQRPEGEAPPEGPFLSSEKPPLI